MSRVGTVGSCTTLNPKPPRSVTLCPPDCTRCLLFFDCSGIDGGDAGGGGGGGGGGQGGPGGEAPSVVPPGGSGSVNEDNLDESARKCVNLAA